MDRRRSATSYLLMMGVVLSVAVPACVRRAPRVPDDLILSEQPFPLERGDLIMVINRTPRDYTMITSVQPGRTFYVECYSEAGADILQGVIEPTDSLWGRWTYALWIAGIDVADRDDDLPWRTSSTPAGFVALGEPIRLSRSFGTESPSYTITFFEVGTNIDVVGDGYGEQSWLRGIGDVEYWEMEEGVGRWDPTTRRVVIVKRWGDEDPIQEDVAPAPTEDPVHGGRAPRTAPARPAGDP